MWDTIKRGEIFNAITPNRKKNGEIFHVDLKIIPLKLPGDILRYVAVARDVTEKINLSEKIQKLQNFDALTGLYNMNAFASSVSKEIENSKGFGGLSLYPRDGKDFKTLYERADIALQRAKKAGPGIHQFFDPDLEKQASKTWEISELIKKLSKKNFSHSTINPISIQTILQ